MLPDLAVLAAVYLLVLLPRWRGLGHRVLAVRTVFFIYLVCVLGVTLLPVLAICRNWRGITMHSWNWSLSVICGTATETQRDSCR